MAPEADEIEAAVGGGFASYGGVRRDILAGAGAASQHGIAAHAAELVDKYAGTDNGAVVNDYLTGYLGAVANDAVVAYYGIVSHVYSLHQQVAIAYDGALFGIRAAVDGHVFTYLVVVANLDSGLLSAKLEILGNGTDYCTGEEDVAVR